ncbi:prepilin-type N-terminal cleavage/methylation domain-containing protein [Ferdinandcohnia quinoae]|uniref:Prepilin-type N-terminal cleavage/methylation domain-containing protein n=1 Tax=Fredinandcohnia quinoae TaxID=2918902 RepID=A0AAW5E986_9BACI|nr:prepilin-type N-terminal cleavage/methylation domain-containing protein [Fredinandcohnia sp. SECRCQ15]MCH1626577.1 prepilin-type N-terminal cleavage/methylation domain-containing protein [Fredinandcohnia sp. SECRCQ15]
MIRNNKGVTLVEVIVVVALLSMVLLLINAVNIFGHKQLSNQSSHIENQSNARLAINILTKEIRSAKTVNVLDNVLTINDSDTYTLDDYSIMKNDNVLISNIYELKIKMQNNKINLKVTSNEGGNQHSISLSTIIYLRE